MHEVSGNLAKGRRLTGEAVDKIPELLTPRKVQRATLLFFSIPRSVRHFGTVPVGRV